MSVKINTYKLPKGVLPKLERDAVKIIREELTNAGAPDGTYLATAVSQITMKANLKFKYVRLQQGQIYAKIKTGDNSTAWEWRITPPSAAEAEVLDRFFSQGDVIRDDDFEDIIPSNRPDNAPVEVEEPASAAAKPPVAVKEEILPSGPVLPPQNGAAGSALDAKFRAAREKALPYAERLQQIELLRDTVLGLMHKIETTEEEIRQLEIAAEKDASGKAAYEKFYRLQQLLDDLDN